MIDSGALRAGLATVRSRIDAACRRADRDPRTVVLVAVTKTFPIEMVQVARAAGIEDFGENRASDLAEKSAAVPARWHYLGKLQTGTARHVADHADVVHSAEPGRALDRVAARAARSGRSIDALAEVDFTGGAHQGVPPEDLAGFLDVAGSLPGVRMVGLMTLPPAPPTEAPDPEASRPYFERLRELGDRLAQRWPDLRELSMGMSADYEVAVEEGATMVRVGTALFGPRRAAPPATTPGPPGP